jgi:hypothetical protein
VRHSFDEDSERGRWRPQHEKAAVKSSDQGYDEQMPQLDCTHGLQPWELWLEGYARGQPSISFFLSSFPTLPAAPL